MRKELIEKIALPEGVSATFHADELTLHKGSAKIVRKIASPRLHVAIHNNEIVMTVAQGAKREFNTLKSYIAHIQNLFAGLNNEFVYHLEACNVHFPMTFKVDKDHLVINNFLGEKTPRKAKILANVVVETKYPKITVTSRDKEAVGQTSANIEKATKIRNRDRRIFQDGIFLVSKEVAK
ncbi:MAG: 50S ribosomal protein L6 [Nanoarchaeota archaeon]